MEQFLEAKENHHEVLSYIIQLSSATCFFKTKLFSQTAELGIAHTAVLGCPEILGQHCSMHTHTGVTSPAVKVKGRLSQHPLL